ncbi:MAG: HlyD family type I secretion periplasmic adaptor subunit [Hyphomicrobiales bacterium]|nr:HlyD family type I secretion periplasmic adaptor subunit [Hyphomicrobiales bacterium]
MAERSTAARSLRQHILFGFVVVLALVAGVGGWAAYASISGAVIAAGSIVVETSIKKVQHKEGGIVGEIRVKEGQRVKAADLLLRLDDTLTRANLAILSKQLDELVARKARLEAERDKADKISFPDDLVKRQDLEPDVADALKGERTLFKARRETMVGQKAQLSERIGQLNDEIAGLDAQRKAKVEESTFINEELSGLDGLFEKGHVTKNRIMSLRREATRLEGQRGQFVSSIARSRGQIAETKLQITQIDQNALTEVVRELRETSARIIELNERRIAALDLLKRVEIRAPRAGFIHQLNVHTVGGVIAPGETVMLIVPEADQLVVEARVTPTDIDQISIGQAAVVRMPAFNQRITPELNAKVTTIAADLTRDEATGLSFYVARLKLDPNELDKLEGKPLVPGMPSEVYIQTGARTALSYLVKPFSDHLQRVFREE